jgi:DNA-binding winged helix-turn-helix (wHTH) protein
MSSLPSADKRAVALAFADCVLDRDTHQLWRAGALVHLPPKVYQLLEVLVAARPRVITKHELDELLWPRTYVARSSLGRLVTELREAIGDDAHEPRLIRTVHAVGYAFCAKVTPAGTTADRICVSLRRGDRVIGLGEGEHIVGRTPDCQLMIDAPGVSRSHARIVIAGASATIAELASKNGTWVNRQRISAATQLRTADEITVGTVALIVHIGGDEVTTQTVVRR